MPDPDSTFRALGLPVALTQSLQRAGKLQAFPIQQAAIPEILQGSDCLLQAATGSGKTLAFGLPLLARLAAGAPAKPACPQGLIIVPTRELGLQIQQHLEPHATALGIRILCFVGGENISKQRRSLAAPAGLIICTPGRLLDLHRRRWINLAEVAVVICDEVDELARQGFVTEVSQLLYRTRNAKQRVFTSATLDGSVWKWVRKYMQQPQLITASSTGEIQVQPATAEMFKNGAVVSGTVSSGNSITPDSPGTPDTNKAVTQAATAVSPNTPAPRQRHWRSIAKPQQLQDFLGELLQHQLKAVVFVNTKAEIRQLAQQLPFSYVLHGDRSQAARVQVLQEFQQCTHGVLLASDVAARGIDIATLDLVVHFHPPQDVTAYIHRSGRTARAQASGDVLVLELDQEAPHTNKLLSAAQVSATQVDFAALWREIPALSSSVRLPRAKTPARVSNNKVARPKKTFKR